MYYDGKEQRGLGYADVLDPAVIVALIALDVEMNSRYHAAKSNFWPIHALPSLSVAAKLVSVLVTVTTDLSCE